MVTRFAGEFGAARMEWLRTNYPVALQYLAIAANLCLLTHLVALSFHGGKVHQGDPFFAENNRLAPTFIWAVGAAVVFALVQFWRRSGAAGVRRRLAMCWRGLVEQVGDFPQVALNYLWGGALVGFALAAALSPWVTIVLVAGLVALSCQGQLRLFLCELAFARLKELPEKSIPGFSSKMEFGIMPTWQSGIILATLISTLFDSVLLQVVLAVFCGLALAANLNREKLPKFLPINSGSLLLLVAILALGVPLLMKYRPFYHPCAGVEMILSIDFGGSLYLIMWSLIGAVAAGIGAVVGGSLAGNLPGLELKATPAEDEGSSAFAGERGMGEVAVDRGG